MSCRRRTITRSMTIGNLVCVGHMIGTHYYADIPWVAVVAMVSSTRSMIRFGGLDCTFKVTQREIRFMRSNVKLHTFIF